MKYKATYGGWYQRTTLHLSEIYQFISTGTSKLSLATQKLRSNLLAMRIEEYSVESSYIEFIKIKTNNGILIKYYEDGLYTLDFESDNLDEAIKTLNDYYSQSFKPAMDYLFSLGAPTPKILANIQGTHQYVVSQPFEDITVSSFNEEKYGKVEKIGESENLKLIQTEMFTFLYYKPSGYTTLDELSDMAIFFREFKNQLSKYLNIHRKVWEEITELKEKKGISTKEVLKVREKLEGYQKSVNLISKRINQMQPYAETRKEIAANLEIQKDLVDLFKYKFDILDDTLTYIQEIWQMTIDYINSGIAATDTIISESTTAGIESLRIITTIGVLGGVVGYLTSEAFQITDFGLIYFFGLILVTWVVNWFIRRFYLSRKFTLEIVEPETKI